MGKKNEIDLIELCINIYLFFKKRIILITSFLIAGLIIGFLKSEKFESFYQTTFIVKSIVDNELICKTINESISIDEISKKNKDCAPQIKSITATVIKPEDKILELYKEKTDIEKPYKISINVIYKNNNCKDVILENINKILDSLPVIKQYFTLNKEMINQLIASIHNEITIANNNEALKENYSSKNQIIFLGQTRPPVEKMVLLAERKFSLEKELLQSKNTIYPIQPSTTPILINNKGKIIKNTLFTGFLGLTLSIIISFILEIAEKAKTT